MHFHAFVCGTNNLEPARQVLWTKRSQPRIKRVNEHDNASLWGKEAGFM